MTEAQPSTTQLEQARQAAIIAAQAADSKKATDIVVQEVGTITSMTDFFIIATAANNRQVEAVLEEIEDQVRINCSMKPLHREGIETGTWALLDYGPLVVHVFQPETREFYRLETLWSDAPTIDLSQEGIEDAEYSERIAKFLSKE